MESPSMKGDPHNPADWQALAERDLKRARHALREDDPGAAIFWLQQSAEKALKGWLIARGWPLLKTHNLNALLAEAAHRGKALPWFEETAARLTDLYTTDRYVVPEDECDPEPDFAETQHHLQTVERLLQTLFPKS